jgi:predicted nuclease of predicted toxin-antitoxin system
VAGRAATACVSLALLLDEMHAPVVAATLRDRGHDVIAVAEQDELRALTDEELFRWAGEHDRRIVTENVKDFAPLLRRAEGLRHQVALLLFTSSRTFPRSRRNPGPLIDALDAWLRAAQASAPPIEDWLQPG